MTQSRIDSAMEAITNIAIGFGVAMVGNFLFIPMVMGVQPSFGESFWIAVLFTLLSFARQYAIRRLFNGRSVWQTIRNTYEKRLTES